MGFWDLVDRPRTARLGPTRAKCLIRKTGPMVCLLGAQKAQRCES